MVVGMSWDEGLIVSHFIASLLKEEGLHLFAFVTSPFKFEGRSRVNLARLIINDLYPLVDSLIWIDLESTKIGHEESTKGIQASIDHKDSMMVSTIRALSDIINPLQIDLSIPFISLDKVQEQEN